jgi:(p)ppGpp synthase/HD superfamily hydrolase
MCPGQEFAIAAHRKVNHLYDDYLPYEFHLRLAAKIAQDFIKLVDPLNRAVVLDAVWAHDTIEDARISYNEIKQSLGLEVAEIVYAVTNDKGKTRKERAGSKYYEGIKQTPHATFVKLADRIANATYGKVFGGSMYKVYQREQDEFEKALAGSELETLRPMLIHLRNLLRG